LTDFLPFFGSTLPRGKGIFQVAEPVAAAFDVDHVGVVQQPVQDGCGERLVPGHQLGPVPHALIGGDQGRAPAVAIGDEAKEQAGLGSVHRLEAELVDNEQGRVQVAFCA